MDAGAAASQALAAGVRFFQYRDKRGSRRSVYETSLRLAGILRPAGALFVVNDHADIALAAGADGVHLGQDDLPLAEARKVLGDGRLIGISTHGVEQAREAQRGGADYIGFGPLFRTATKDAGPLQGLAALRGVRAAVAVPVIAIGGIHAGNVRDALAAGADGAAIISAVLGASDIATAARELVELTGGR